MTSLMDFHKTIKDNTLFVDHKNIFFLRKPRFNLLQYKRLKFRPTVSKKKKKKIDIHLKHYHIIVW
jgi:hypothetical protein